ncbi:MAG: proline--tRNA ligase, partial [Bacteroidota bacterium]
EYIERLLNDIQQNLLEKAKSFRMENTHKVDSYEEFKKKIENGGFYYAHWDGTKETEAKIKEETQATIRCIPLEDGDVQGSCMVTGKPSARRVIFAKAY